MDFSHKSKLLVLSYAEKVQIVYILYKVHAALTLFFSKTTESKVLSFFKQRLFISIRKNKQRKSV